VQFVKEALFYFALSFCGMLLFQNILTINFWLRQLINCFRNYFFQNPSTSERHEKTRKSQTQNTW